MFQEIWFRQKPYPYPCNSQKSQPWSRLDMYTCKKRDLHCKFVMRCMSLNHYIHSHLSQKLHQALGRKLLQCRGGFEHSLEAFDCLMRTYPSTHIQPVKYSGVRKASVKFFQSNSAKIHLLFRRSRNRSLSIQTLNRQGILLAQSIVKNHLRPFKISNMK